VIGTSTLNLSDFSFNTVFEFFLQLICFLPKNPNSILFRAVELGNSFLYPFGNLLLVADGFLLSKPDGTIDRLKTCLVAKGYTQIFGLDYGDSFSPVAKMIFVRLFITVAALQR